MSRDRTLEEFVPTEESADTAPDVEEAPDSSPATRDSQADDVEPRADTAETAADRPDPLLSTYAYDESGGPCASCGEAATERWRGGTDLVCGDCKEW